MQVKIPQRLNSKKGGLEIAENTFSEISCPLCRKVLRVKEGKPRTLKQWRVSLMVHLVASPGHYLGTEEAKDIVDSYLNKNSANS